YRGAVVDDQIRGQAAQFPFGVGFPFPGLVADAPEHVVNAVAVFFHAVGGQANGYVGLEAALHEVEELVAGLLHQLLGFDFAHQLAFALFELGDDIGEVGDDAFGVFVGVEQVVDFAALGEGGQGVERVAGLAVPGGAAVADGFDQRLGEQAAKAAEGVGGLEGGLVYLAFEPAVVNQAVEDPAGLFAVVAEAALVVIVALEQGRAFQCFAEDVQHLFALERLAVVGAGAVQAVVQQAQAFDDLFAV